jgi:hypothetical protein
LLDAELNDTVDEIYPDNDDLPSTSVASNTNYKIIRGKNTGKNKKSQNKDNNGGFIWNDIGEARPRFPFTGNPGIKVEISRENKPIEYFDKFFDDSIINEIVQQTNIYAQQFVNENNLKARSRVIQWEDTNSDEIRVYLALLLLQGIVYKPEQAQYFSKKQSISTPFFAAIMLKDRFLLLSKFLHFTDNKKFDSDGPIPRKLFKIWPILEHMKQKFSQLYIPERDVAIDESLLLWKGRLSWKQYIPTKRARFGIKSFEICESTSGYIWDFFVYLGKGTEYDAAMSPDEPMGSKVVYTLAKPLFGKGYCIHMDNFFSSPQLYKKLCENHTDAVGTLRSNRQGVPKQLVQTKLKQGELKSFYSDKIMVMKWKDKKDVYMISTTHDHSTKITGGEHARKAKPVVCCDYNDSMGGVDLSDAFLSCYPTARKRLKKYYMKQFRHILDMACLNAHILFKMNGGTLTTLAFLIRLVDELIEKYHVPIEAKCKGRPSHGDTPVRLTGRHFLAPLPPTDKKVHPQKRCHVCYSKGIRKGTIYGCPDCLKPLCVEPCFRIYHTVLKY